MSLKNSGDVNFDHASRFFLCFCHISSWFVLAVLWHDHSFRSYCSIFWRIEVIDTIINAMLIFFFFHVYSGLRERRWTFDMASMMNHFLLVDLWVCIVECVNILRVFTVLNETCMDWCFIGLSFGFKRVRYIHVYGAFSFYTAWTLFIILFISTHQLKLLLVSLNLLPSILVFLHLSFPSVFG